MGSLMKNILAAGCVVLSTNYCSQLCSWSRIGPLILHPRNIATDVPFDAIHPIVYRDLHK
jgi:hypothetical protein